MAERLRAADRAELLAAIGPVPPAAQLERGIREGESSYLAEADGRPVALFGAVHAGSAAGEVLIWMVGSDEIARLRRELLLVARAYLPRMLAGRAGVNVVDSRNVVHLRFLRRLGAEVYAGREVYQADPAVPFWPFRLHHVQPAHRRRRHRGRPAGR